MIAVTTVSISDDVAVVLFFGLVAVVVIVITVCITAVDIYRIWSRERVERWKIDHDIYKREQGK